MWGNGRKDINLDQAEFTDMGLLSKGCSLNAAAWEV